jgi:hypothetical protein
VIRSTLIEHCSSTEVNESSDNDLQIGAVAFIHRFGSTLNEHIHLHVCVIDGVFTTVDQATQFYPAKPFSAQLIERVQQTVRRRLLRAFVGRGYLDSSDAKAMQAYDHSGGFSVDASVRIGQHDRAGLERLLRYCARPPFAGERIRIEGEQVVYLCPKAPAGERAGVNGASKANQELVLSPLELIARIAALVPPPRQHRHRYYGVLAPNAAQRSQVVPAQEAVEPSNLATVDDVTSVPTVNHPARYAWAKLIARVYEIDPLKCLACGGQMTIIAFVMQASEIKKILEHVGLPTQAPKAAAARGPPQADLWQQNGANVDPADEDQSVQW